MEISLDCLIQRDQNIVSSEIDGETVMMDTGFEKYFGMKTIATRIWQIIEQQTSLQSLCETLVEEYDVTMEQCMEDIRPFICELAEQNMVQLTQSRN